MEISFKILHNVSMCTFRHLELGDGLVLFLISLFRDASPWQLLKLHTMKQNENREGKPDGNRQNLVAGAIFEPLASIANHMQHHPATV